MRSLYGKVIENVGLHARPASLAVNEAGKYKAQITLYYGDKSANLKSIIQIMKISVPVNAQIEIQCDGEDENEAAAGIREILEKKHIIEFADKEGCE